MGRKLMVWLVAFALRRGIPPADVLGLLAKSHRHQLPDWRMDLINDATIRNMRRAERKTHEPV